ncbi:MAG: hypothetical protein NTY73_02125 [Candidatus Micrarchaeota archaeon]|nr:hypothetical protein [Candidatus Micrarchaeota archaeon]
MAMRRGFAGLLVLSVFMLGFVFLLSSHSQYIASKNYRSMVSAEIHSDRIAIARNIITRSYRHVDEKGRVQWATSIADSLSNSYGLKVSMDSSSYPIMVNVTDPSSGLSTSFSVS